MKPLLAKIRKCSECSAHLPFGPNPVVSASVESKIIIVGQAPGKKVHESGVPWDDKSGENLRSWLGVDEGSFYNTSQFALIPMGFCYPGRGKSGDLPPRPECAPLWHEKLLNKMQNPRLVLLIGQYSQDYYLRDKKMKTLTETVKNFQNFLPDYFPLPHPSPRNNIWQAKNKWFAKKVLPKLKSVVWECLYE